VSGPLVTIVTPSYNQGHFIRETIESVLSQDYPRIEYIVMDGGSTDDTAAVVAPYASRLTFISEKDRGQTDAINKGFRMAKGEIVAWLNSDDTLLPGAVSCAVRALEANQHAGAIYGDGYQIDYHGKIKQKFPFTEPFNLWKLTFVLDYVLQQSVFFRRSSVEAVGWLDETLHYGMDWDILVRLGKEYGLVYVPELFGCLREYEEAKSFSGGERRFGELARLLRRQSGEARPPGWWFYGLDTYDKVWKARIEKCIPGSLGRMLAMRFVHVCRWRIDRAQHRSQGTYADGWASPVMHWMMPACYSKMSISGTVPEWAPVLKHQTLYIFLNGNLVREVKVGQGTFAIEVPLARHPKAGAPVIRVESSHAVIPAQSGLGPDPRALAWRMGGFDGVV
jgi:glycosyltransferase involved in cell wall biosynthesis